MQELDILSNIDYNFDLDIDMDFNFELDINTFFDNSILDNFDLFSNEKQEM